MRHAAFFRQKQLEEIIKTSDSIPQDQALLKRQQDSLDAIEASSYKTDKVGDDDDDESQDIVDDFEQVTFVSCFDSSDEEDGSSFADDDSDYSRCDDQSPDLSSMTIREACDQEKSIAAVQAILDHDLRKAFALNKMSAYDASFFKQYSNMVIKTPFAESGPPLQAIGFTKTTNNKTDQHTWNLPLATILAQACDHPSLKHITPNMVKIVDSEEIDYPIWPAVDADIPSYCKEHIISSTNYKSNHDRYLYHTCDLQDYDIVILDSPTALPCGPAAWTQMAHPMKASAFVISNVSNSQIGVLRPKEIITFYKQWYQGNYSDLAKLDPTRTSVLSQLIDSVVLRLCCRHACKKPEWDHDDDDE